MSRRARPAARALAAAGAALALASLALAAYPTACEQVGAARARSQQSEAADAWSAAGDGRADGAVAAALAANEAIAEGRLDEAEATGAGRMLDADGSGVVSWLEAPSIGLLVPVRAAADEESLMYGAALVEGTSLPVGGESANTVVVGHSGMRNARMFDGLDGLSEGDELVFWTAGRPFAYRVTGSELVEPEEAGELSVDPGVDQATLVTCRPIGVNSQRLLVHAERCERGEGAPDGGGGGAARQPGPPAWASPLACGLGALAAALLALLAWARRPWRLVRVTGARPLAEADVARLGRDAGPMRLDLRRGGRLRLRLFGADARGTWGRSRDDLGAAYRLELDGCAFGPYRLPEGPFTARERDGELRIWADGGASALRFERRRPRRNGTRDGKEAGNGR